MQVQVDNVWATPSNLHVRVTVWADDRRWRHRFDVAVPAGEISPEAIALLVPEDRVHYLEDVALPGL